MKKVSEFLKDFLYDSMDYLIMLSIVGVVVFVIGWRLDILFAERVVEDKSNPTELVEVIDKDSIPTTDIADLNNTEITSPEEEASNTIKSEVLANEPQDQKEESKPEEKAPETAAAEVPKVETPKVEETPTPTAETVNVEIPAGSSSEKIGQILVSKGLVSSAQEFTKASESLGLSTKLKSGQYSIAANSSVEDVVRKIAK